jgi:hypothetical protein
MPNKRWIKDYCPFAKDQGFMSIVGDVAPGETVFGFTIPAALMTANTGIALTFAQLTSGYGMGSISKVTQMKDAVWRAMCSAVTSGSEILLPKIYAKTKVGFTIKADASKDYDVVIIGRILY